jgi:molybdopterin-guanine dinucleotide biosynthesis protein A
MDAIVAILAGGRSRRMGEAKPSAILAGRPLISYPLEAARAGGLEPRVVAKEGSRLPPLDCRILIEPAEPTHPLCGILAALREARPAPVIAVAADMPFVTDELLRWLASQPSTTAVEAGGRLQPLLASYGADALAPLEAALATGASLTAALRGLAPRLVGEQELRRFGDPELLCLNVNTPEDLARAEEIVRARRPA